MSDPTPSRLEALQTQAAALLDETGGLKPDGPPVPRWRRVVHFWVLVVRNFNRNRCPVRASALAYSSLLALVPMLAVALSVTTSVLKSQGEAPIRAFVDKLVDYVAPYVEAPAQPGPATAEENSANDGRAKRRQARAEAAAAREQAVRQINEFINRTRNGAIGFTGAIALLLVAILMLARIESTFNDIWGVMRGRNWYLRVVLYWAAISLGPIIIISALGLASTSQLRADMTESLGFLTRNPIVNALITSPFVKGTVSNLLPVAVLSVTFAMIYLLLPNTRVQFSAALVGGFTAGLLWHLNNKGSVVFISRITSNNAVYGSLGMVPVLMIGLYLGWLILLFGAQVAYAWQNREAYAQERLAEGINQRGREFLALRLLTRMTRHFLAGEPPRTLLQLANGIGAPTRLSGQVIQTLLKAKLVLEVNDREASYAPARPPRQITIHNVLTAMRDAQGAPLQTHADAERESLRTELARLASLERNEGSRSLEELAVGGA